MMLVAPLSANTLAKISNGLCDNLLVRKQFTQDEKWSRTHDDCIDGAHMRHIFFWCVFSFPPQTTVIRCWSFNTHPLLLSPAMNTVMWDSPFTSHQLSRLTSLGIIVIPPIAKKLACGDVGAGAMATVEQLDQQLRQTWIKLVGDGYQQQQIQQ